MLRRRTFAQRTLAALLSTAAVSLTAAPGSAAAGDTVNILVLRENGAGSASTAQKYIDQVMQSVARVNGWPAASGKYFTTRAPALAFISEAHPHFGIVSLAAYLGMRKAHRLALLGKAEIRGGGGQQYYLVSKTAKDLAGCKGQSLATNHADDPRFVENVIAGGAFKLGEFELDKTRRPLQTVKKVIRDEAACALIDDAQMAELAQMDGGDALKPVWFSARLPPMVVVAFPQAPKAQAKAFAANLTRVCDGAGRASCDAAGIDALEPVKASALADLTAKYGK